MQQHSMPPQTNSDRELRSIDRFMAVSRETSKVIRGVLDQYDEQFKYKAIETSYGCIELCFGDSTPGAPNGPHILVIGDKVIFTLHKWRNGYDARGRGYEGNCMGSVNRTEGDDRLRKHVGAFLRNVGYSKLAKITYRAPKDLPEVPKSLPGSGNNRSLLRLRRDEPA